MSGNITTIGKVKVDNGFLRVHILANQPGGHNRDGWIKGSAITALWIDENGNVSVNLGDNGLYYTVAESYQEILSGIEESYIQSRKR